MSFLVVGLNHQTASLSVREQFAFSQEKVADCLRQLKALTDTPELLLLSTCHRTEVYCASEESEKILSALCTMTQAAGLEEKNLWYVLYDEAAVRHLVRVASGLDSMMLGEPQIFGQVKQAYNQANQLGMVGKTLHKAFQYAFSLAKKVRNQTDIGKNPVSVAFAGVTLAKHFFSTFENCTVLVLGAGETAALCAQHFMQLGDCRFFFVNRTLDNARKLTQQFPGEAYPLEELPLLLSQADIVVAATQASGYLVDVPLFKSLVRQKRGSAMLFLDLSMPRVISPALSDCVDCYLYTLDDLQSIVADNLAGRRDAATLAEQMINFELSRYAEDSKIADHAEAIKQFKARADELMAQLHETLPQKVDKEEVVALTKKFAKQMQHQALQLLQETIKN